ncbi:MAG TPA: DUF2569 family protein [Acetobacteraceae bacterium]|jgi:hypothetical protein
MSDASEGGRSRLAYDARRGVGGWLLFLCISMVFITPIFKLVTTLGTWPSESLMNLYNLRGAFYTAAVFDVLMTGWLIYAGIRLWMVAPNAVFTAKLALIGNLVGFIISMFLLVGIADAPPVFADAVWPEAIKQGLREAVYVGIWTWYLSVSKRVAATYQSVPVSPAGT